MFDALAPPSTSARWRRGLFFAGSAALHGGVVLVVVLSSARGPERDPRPAATVVFYGPRHLAPAARAISTSPPILATPRRTSPPVAAPAPKRVERPPPSEPTEEAAPAPVERGAEEAGGSAAEPAPSGAVGLGNGGGGDPAALGAEPTSPRPASPADLASIGARVARELVYPALARRRQWQGRALVAFTLRADGSVGAIEIRESSGHPLLDEEAQRAIRRAAPFPAPGVELLVVVPVTFQLR